MIDNKLKEDLTITLRIADRPYRLSINRDEEEIFRKAAKMIDDKLSSYASNFAFKDKKDLLAMVALEHTAGLLKHENSIAKHNESTKKLVEIDTFLSNQIEAE